MANSIILISQKQSAFYAQFFTSLYAPYYLKQKNIISSLEIDFEAYEYYKTECLTKFQDKLNTQLIDSGNIWETTNLGKILMSYDLLSTYDEQFNQLPDQETIKFNRDDIQKLFSDNQLNTNIALTNPILLSFEVTQEEKKLEIFQNFGDDVLYRICIGVTETAKITEYLKQFIEKTNPPYYLNVAEMVNTYTQMDKFSSSGNVEILSMNFWFLCATLFTAHKYHQLPQFHQPIYELNFDNFKGLFESL